jgi:hypothetical protein
LLQLSDDQYTIKGLQYALKKMEVYAQNQTGAWAFTTGSRAVVVGLAGPGFNPSPDLLRNMWFNACESSCHRC